MLLAIDIGNTNINLAVFKGNRIARRYIIPTKEKKYLAFLRQVFIRHKIGDAIVCSVVPRVLKILEKDLRRLLGRKPYIIGKNIRVPIKNRYRNPSQVGQDRLVNAYTGVKLYGAPLIAVDFGTAITFDIITANKEYLGGMILPGLEISLDILAQRTALLPKIKLEKPKEFVGRDTENSMLSGIVYGFAALTNEMAAKIKNKIGKRAKVIGTGGDISLMARYCQCFNKIDPDLTLKGLNLIHSAAFSFGRLRTLRRRTLSNVEVKPSPLGLGRITPLSVSTPRQTSDFSPRLEEGLIFRKGGGR